MFKNRNLMVLITLLVLLAAAVPTVLAADASGSAKFAISDTVFVAGNEIRPGAYDVKWEANGSEATVKFINQGKEVAKIAGKIVELEKKGDYNSLALGKDSAGRGAILGMHFAGKKLRITFE